MVKFSLRKNALHYIAAFSLSKNAHGLLEVLQRVWRGDKETRLFRFCLTLNVFGTFLIFRLLDLGDDYE